MNSGNGINIPQAGEDYLLGTAKVPPPWNPAWQERYPFRKWVRDITVWSLATELPHTSIASNVVLRLGGTAREISEELSPEQLMHGRWVVDMNGQWTQEMTGLGVLIQRLTAQFGYLDGESCIKSIADCIYFRAGPHEDVDSVSARFTALHNRCADEAHVDFGFEGRAWVFLTGLQIPPEEWYDMLQPLDGKLPSSQTEFRQLISRIKRKGHMYRKDGMARAASAAKARNHFFGQNELSLIHI